MLPTSFALGDTVSDAKSEGGLMLYSGAKIKTNEKLLKAFKKKYPFVKETQLYRAGGPALAARIEAELRANKKICDILFAAGAFWVNWVKDGKVLKYQSPEYKNYTAEYKIDGYMAAVRASSMTIAFNTNKVKPSARPSTYDDLLNPKWKDGWIGIPDVRRSSKGRAWYTVAREQLGKDFMIKLAKQKPLILKGGSDLSARLQAGEIAIGIQNSERVIVPKRKGVPVDAVWPKEGVVLAPGYAGIIASAPHANTAKLFMDFILGEEGQTILSSNDGYHTLHRNMKSASDIPDIGTFKVWTVDEEKVGALTNEINKEFTQLFT
jgi:iron(III) transport system substrate-binding protein